MHIEEEEEEKEDPMSQSDSSSLLAEAEAVSRIVTVQLERVSSLFSFFAIFNTVVAPHRFHVWIGSSKS